METDFRKKQERFEDLLEKVYDRAIKRKDGSRLRQLVKVVANAYKDNPRQLESPQNGNYPNFPYEDCGEKITGIASSAYQFLTGDFKAIQFLIWGGLGAIITESPPDLEFSENQLQFARISGTALKRSKNKENSLQYAQTSGDALEGSQNHDDALQFSRNSGNSLENAQNSGDSLHHSTNTGTSLTNSRNSGNSFQHSENSEESLRISRNCGNAMQYSRNSGNSLRYSVNSAFALFRSKNSGNALFHSYNEDFALYDSENTSGVLQGSSLPDYRENLKESLVRESQGLRYDNIPQPFRDELDKIGGQDLFLRKLKDLLENERRGVYTSPRFFKEGGTRYLFLVDWGPGPVKRKRIIKIDKPLSALSSPRAVRAVGERGCGTTNELSLISQIEHSGITQLLDYFTPNVSGKYGFSGSITLEEYFPDSKSLEEIVISEGPLRGKLFREFVSQAVSIVDTVFNFGVYHRDIKPSNFLIQRKNGLIGVKLTDFANACRTDHPQVKYFPTLGGHLTSDPLLMTPFTVVESAYTEGSEIYALFSTIYFAGNGSYMFDYNPDLMTARIIRTGENPLTDGKLDFKKHDQALELADQNLPSKIRQNLIFEIMLSALSLDPKKRKYTLDRIDTEVNE